ncbi:MAG: hypothetical protein DMG81_16685, partial [Acidobacteria bacterium]
LKLHSEPSVSTPSRQQSHILLGSARDFADNMDGTASSSRPKFVVECNDQVEDEGREPSVLGQAGPDATGNSASGDRAASSESPGSPETQLQPDLLAQDSSSWRQEVSERLHRYHARRRPRAPRYPSLRLKFEAPEAKWSAPSRDVPLTSQSTQPAPVQSAVRQAVAREYVDPVASTPILAAEHPTSEPIPAIPRRRVHEVAAKIIEFPRTMYAPQAHLHDLAESILDRPRILEAPEIVPPPPALGGLTIEETKRPEPERRAGIDMPLQTAIVEDRLLAVAIDACIVLTAAVVFSGVVYKVSGAKPGIVQSAVFGAGLLGVLWAAYQYFLIVYSATTPGLRALKLRLERFDGKPVNRRLRRWRVLASMLSGISLGMGYAWHFLDEDGLCWHERVTKTHLAPAKR